MRLRLDHGRINALLLLGLLTDCATSPQAHIPTLGRYHFTAQWMVAGFADPAMVVGDMDITAATPDEMIYTFTLHESGGREIVSHDTAAWDEGNGYLPMTGTVGRAGVWFLLPHLKPGAACYGNAYNASQSYGVPMTCHWNAP